MSNLGLL